MGRQDDTGSDFSKVERVLVIDTQSQTLYDTLGHGQRQMAWAILDDKANYTCSITMLP